MKCECHVCNPTTPSQPSLLAMVSVWVLAALWVYVAWKVIFTIGRYLLGA